MNFSKRVFIVMSIRLGVVGLLTAFCSLANAACNSSVSEGYNYYLVRDCWAACTDGNIRCSNPDAEGCCYWRGDLEAVTEWLNLPGNI